MEVVVSKINLYCGDSLQAMREMDDNQYDLAIVDPPYGIGGKDQRYAGNGSGKLKNRILNQSAKKFADWDNEIPPPEYFVELMRVSKNQIIWGGNYFDLPPSRCVICWDKCQPWTNFSQWEMAWTSFDKPASLYRFANRTGDKIHPTQKPVSLYHWVLSKYAKKGDRILDTHLGSGSIAIACHDMGFDLDGWELDTDYYHKAVQRFDNHTKQIQLF